MSEAVQKRIVTCVCVVVCVMLICAAVVGGIRAKNEPADACKCEGCKCNPQWEADKLWKHERGWDIDQIKKHLREQGHNIGVAPPRPVGSAK